MRRVLPMSLVVLAALQPSCARDEVTGPQVEPIQPQVIAAGTVSRIAFASIRDGRKEIYVIEADGSGIRRVTDNSFTPASDGSPSWSPDGQELAFERDGSSHSGIWVVNKEGTSSRRLTTLSGDWSPSWSPDGRQIAFMRLDGPGEIYVMTADGSSPTRLTDHPGHDYDPTWSPDGRQIAFSRRDGNQNGDIYVMNADGSSQTRLTNHFADDDRPSWSPDGRQIAFSSHRDGNYEIYVMNADGSAPTRLTNNPGTDFNPSWSSNGLIAFESFRNGSEDIFVMAADGSAQTQVTSGPGLDADPSFGSWVDVTPPELSGVGITSRLAQGAFGSRVSFSFLAKDDFDLAPEVVCTPTSGSIFPIGTTQAECIATDDVGNTSRWPFSVTVRGPYEELGVVAGLLESLISNNRRDGRATHELEDVLAKVQAASEKLGRTPPDRPPGVAQLKGVPSNLEAALQDGELSAFGFNILVPLVPPIARLAADQAIAEARASGGNAEQITAAEEALAEGDSMRAARRYKEAIALYQQACDAVSDD